MVEINKIGKINHKTQRIYGRQAVFMTYKLQRQYEEDSIYCCVYVLVGSPDEDYYKAEMMAYNALYENIILN